MSYTPTARERYLELCAEPAPRRLRPPRPPRPTIAPPPRPAPPSILDDVARVFAVEPAALAGRSRLPATVAARQAAMLVLREHYRLSLPMIGSMLGRDHSTVHHGVAAAAARRDRDAGYAAQIAALVEGGQP